MGREREAMLEAFELGPRADYFPRGLSGGMKRKACVALAVTGDTRLVVLDEPTTGLDPGARRRLWDTLAMLKRGRTILLTTHFVSDEEYKISARIFLATLLSPYFTSSIHHISFFVAVSFASHGLFCRSLDGRG